MECILLRSFSSHILIFVTTSVSFRRKSCFETEGAPCADAYCRTGTEEDRRADCGVSEGSRRHHAGGSPSPGGNCHELAAHSIRRFPLHASRTNTSSGLSIRQMLSPIPLNSRSSPWCTSPVYSRSKTSTSERHVLPPTFRWSCTTSARSPSSMPPSAPMYEGIRGVYETVQAREGVRELVSEWTAKHVPENDRSRFISLVHAELRGLREGNCGRRDFKCGGRWMSRISARNCQWVGVTLWYDTIFSLSRESGRFLNLRLHRRSV